MARPAAFAMLCVGLLAGGPVAAHDAPSAERVYPQLAHVAVVVDDMDAAIRDVTARMHLDPTAVVTHVKVPVSGALYDGQHVDYSADFCLIELGNTQLELIQPLKGRSPYSDALKAHGARPLVHHLAYVVPSIDERLDEARKANPGIKIVLDAKMPGDVGRFVYVDGIVPGTFVEFIQFNAKARQ